MIHKLLRRPTSTVCQLDLISGHTKPTFCFISIYVPGAGAWSHFASIAVRNRSRSAAVQSVTAHLFLTPVVSPTITCLPDGRTPQNGSRPLKAPHPKRPPTALAFATTIALAFPERARLPEIDSAGTPSTDAADRNIVGSIGNDRSCEHTRPIPSGNVQDHGK